MRCPNRPTSTDSAPKRERHEVGPTPNAGLCDPGNCIVRNKTAAQMDRRSNVPG